MARWADENRKAAAEFWSRSKVSIADPLLENLWYETFHARRCVYRRRQGSAGAVPAQHGPRLLAIGTATITGTTTFKQPYWGDYTANHLDLGDAYFDGMDFALALPAARSPRTITAAGACSSSLRRIRSWPRTTRWARCPMGRMAYMTGWAMTQYWWRYRYTLDKEWLRVDRLSGDPRLRLVLHRFHEEAGRRPVSHLPLQSGRGRLHRQSEGLHRPGAGDAARAVLPADGDSGRRSPGRGRGFARRVARAAATMQPATTGGRRWRSSGLAKECYEANPPEFGIGHAGLNNYRPEAGNASARIGLVFRPVSDRRRWAVASRRFRGRSRSARSFAAWFEAWRRPNGLSGAWPWPITAGPARGPRSLGVAAPLQEMMLQSWDGARASFPPGRRSSTPASTISAPKGRSWSAPPGRVATSRRFRSAACAAPCKVYSPWPKGFAVVDASGGKVAVTSDAYGRPEFATRPGGLYRLSPYPRE